MPTGGFLDHGLSLGVANGVPVVAAGNSHFNRLDYYIALDASGDSWTDWYEMTTIYDDLEITSLDMTFLVSKPVVCFRSADGLKYSVADDGAGSSWGTPSNIATQENVGTNCSAIGINGMLAVSYADNNADSLKYALITEP